jgi:hypothetical protein
MRSKPTSLLCSVLVLAGTLAAVDTVAYAATGKAVLLGKANTSKHATTLTRSTPGSVLSLKVKPGSPPLAVSSSTKVVHLNADQLDGVDASALGTRTTTFTDTDASTRSDYALSLEGLRPGAYLVSWSVGLYQVTPSASASAPAIFQGYFAVDLDHPYVVPGSAVEPDGNSYAFMSGSGLMTVGTDEPEFVLDDRVGGSTFAIGPDAPLSISFTPTTNRGGTGVAARGSEGHARQASASSTSTTR